MHTKKERRCSACRQSKQKEDMIRIARIKGTYVIDEKQSLGGRGAYVCKDPECIKYAIKKRTFNRAFRTNVDSSIYENLGEYEKNN